jgi:two-component system OmpR family sensor kinase
MPRRLPIRARLTLISASLMAAALVALGAFVYLRFEVELRDAIDSGLRSRAETVLGDPNIIHSGGRLADPEEAFAQLLGVDGSVLDASPGMPERPLLSADQAAALRGSRLVDAELRMEEETVPVRLLAVPAGDGRVLVIGTSLEDQQEALARLLALLAVVGPFAVAISSGVGWLVAGAALRPVERLRVEADAMSSSESGRRLRVPETGDELARLGLSLNQMLGRLEEALEHERRFVGAASHELRTPLANLKAELDLALRRARTHEQLVSALRSAAEETNRLTRLAEDLLVLARADGGRLPLRREKVDVGQLVRDEVETFGGRAAVLGISLRAEVAGQFEAEVDGARLRQAIGNLIDNALRQSPIGGHVVVGVAMEGQMLRIAVADDGAGFEPGFLHRAFDPFSRSDAARSRSGGGTGLGLAIIRAVVEAHGGSVAIRNQPGGGASVELVLPL